MSVANPRHRVVPRLIEDEMRESFIDYSMSVIVQRALPDVRDGLKPVHRRILYAMHESGLSPSRPFKKSATVVGDVLGKYHPHGDSAVYDALVRMVQDFSLRYPLIAGQGNFGSLDGDSAAAYRYTEARLAPVAGEMLADIDKDTADFSPNFDGRLSEPTVLPARLPNLLVNGSSGIAVGMSTNIPPHNLREVARALIHLLDHPDCSIDDLMRIIPGPDFPTGGLIVGKEGIRKAYETGRGRVIMQARIGKEPKRGGREQLVVTEIPYATNKSRIIEQIAALTKRGKIPDISDLRDESDRDGIRIVIELKRGADVDGVLKSLFKWTALQSTFGVITLALDGGIPREFSLKQLLEHFRDHRVEVVVRRSRWELGKAQDEVHVLEGLLIALDNIDKTVRLIRSSRTRATAAKKLRNAFGLTERQVEAILLMRLYRLTALETRELKERLAQLEKRIRELDAILKNPARQIAEIRGEIEEILERYGDARRTRIMEGGKKMVIENLAAQEDVVVTMSRQGYIKQIPMAVYRRRLGSGKALAGMERYDDDYLEHVFVASTADTLMFFTGAGQAYWLPVADIPEAGRASRGKALHGIIELPRTARVAALLSLAGLPDGAVLVFFTEKGMVKRTALREFRGQRVGGVNAINLKKGDRLLDVQVSDGTNDLVLASRKGRAIRFPEENVSEMGRAAQGVRGIKLAAADRMVGGVVVRRGASLCLVTEKGFANRVPLSELAVQRRDGLGAAVTRVSAKTGAVIAAKELLDGDNLMAVTNAGQMIRLPAGHIPLLDPGTPGDPVLSMAKGDRIVEVTRAADHGAAPGGGESGEADAEDAAGLAGEGTQFELLGASEE